MTPDEVLAPALTREQARTLTDEVKADAQALWARVMELYEGSAHLALGYSSWHTYWTAEFGQDGSRGYQLVQAGRVHRELAHSTIVERPANEAIARELTPLLGRPVELERAWRTAVEIAEGQPTAAQVRELVRSVEPDAEPEPPETRKVGARALGQAHKTVAQAAQNCWALSLGLRHADLDAIRQLEPDPEEVEQWNESLREARTWITRLLMALSRDE